MTQIHNPLHSTTSPLLQITSNYFPNDFLLLSVYPSSLLGYSSPDPPPAIPSPPSAYGFAAHPPPSSPSLESIHDSMLYNSFPPTLLITSASRRISRSTPRFSRFTWLRSSRWRTCSLLGWIIFPGVNSCS